MKTSYNILRSALAISDIILINLTYFLGFYLSNKYGTSIDKETYQNSLLAFNLIWVGSTASFKLYSATKFQQMSLVSRATIKSIVLHLCGFAVYLFISNNGGFPTTLALSFSALVAFSFSLSRLTGTALQTMTAQNISARRTYHTI